MKNSKHILLTGLLLSALSGFAQNGIRYTFREPILEDYHSIVVRSGSHASLEQGDFDQIILEVPASDSLKVQHVCRLEKGVLFLEAGACTSDSNRIRIITCKRLKSITVEKASDLLIPKGKFIPDDSLRIRICMEQTKEAGHSGKILLDGDYTLAEKLKPLTSYECPAEKESWWKKHPPVFISHADLFYTSDPVFYNNPYNTKFKWEGSIGLGMLIFGSQHSRWLGRIELDISASLRSLNSAVESQDNKLVFRTESSNEFTNNVLRNTLSCWYLEVPFALEWRWLSPSIYPESYDAVRLYLRLKPGFLLHESQNIEYVLPDNSRKYAGHNESQRLDNIFNPWRIRLEMGMWCGGLLDIGFRVGLLPVYKAGACEHNFHEFGVYVGF